MKLPKRTWSQLNLNNALDLTPTASESSLLLASVPEIADGLNPQIVDCPWLLPKLPPSLSRSSLVISYIPVLSCFSPLHRIPSLAPQPAQPSAAASSFIIQGRSSQELSRCACSLAASL
ncbi:hypothetical protein FSOLCH5_001539 [Fusarium solani]